MKDLKEFFIWGSIAFGIILIKIAIIFGVVYGICLIIKYMFF